MTRSTTSMPVDEIARLIEDDAARHAMKAARSHVVKATKALEAAVRVARAGGLEYVATKINACHQRLLPELGDVASLMRALEHNNEETEDEEEQECE